MNTHRWRTVDIVVASILAVAFGVIFWALDLLWNGPMEAILASFPPGRAVVYGIWLIPAILGPLIIRKPGAALYTELLAATVSALLGTNWGILVLWYGLAQGAAGELGFALFAWKRWTWVQAVLAALFAGLAASALDLYNFYAFWAANWQISYVFIVVASTIVVAGLGSLYLTKELARTGVLDRFPSGRLNLPS